MGDCMGKIISLVNQKGGVGKTTTSINLSASLAVLGKKVLLIDLDPQGNTTTGVGINKGEIERSIYNVLIGECKVSEATLKTKYKDFYIVPSSINMAGLGTELLERSRTETGFNYSEQLKNALVASNSVIIPVQCEFFALEGITQLLNSIMLAQKNLNPIPSIINAEEKYTVDESIGKIRDVIEDLKKENN